MKPSEVFDESMRETVVKLSMPWVKLRAWKFLVHNGIGKYVLRMKLSEALKLSQHNLHRVVEIYDREGLVVRVTPWSTRYYG